MILQVVNVIRYNRKFSAKIHVHSIHYKPDCLFENSILIDKAFTYITTFKQIYKSLT